MTSGGEGGASTEDRECEPNLVQPNEVVVLGDSFFATTHEVTGYIEASARADGVISEGERYRDYSNLSSNALALGAPGIAGQYANAQADSNVRVVIMNGGGADVLLGTCDVVEAECPVISEALLAFEDLLSQMSADGVGAVVFVGYPDPQITEVREMMEVLLPLLESACTQRPSFCHYLDLQAVFAGRQDDYLLPDGLNPTSLGAQASAVAIWDLMGEACIAQN
jgi:hypothetical protein